MTRKKVQVPEVKKEVRATKKKRPAALTEHGAPRLRKDQLMKFRMMEAEVRAAQSAFQMADLQLNVLINSRPEVVAANTGRKIAQEEFRKKRDEYRAYVEELGKMLGLDMGKVTIDDETGLVREVESAGPGTVE